MAHGWGVDRLVPGDPDGIRVLAGSVAQYAAVTADAAAGLGRLDPQWTGAAYERFWEALIGHRQGFIEASVAFDAAGVALEVYAAELDAGKVEARTAGVWWEQGVDAAREHAMVEFLAGRSVSPPVTGGGSVGLVCSPAGAGLRADAVAKLDGAWADVDRAARVAIDALVTAQAKAPQAPHWWDTAVPNFIGLFGTGDSPVKREFAAGVVRGFIDLGTANGNRTINASLDARLDGWEKSHGINPHGGVHGIGGFASGLLIPGFGAEGFVASLAAEAANRAAAQLAKEAATTLAKEAGTTLATGTATKVGWNAVEDVADILRGLPKGRSSGVRTVANGRELDELYRTLSRGAPPLRSLVTGVRG